MMQLSSHLVLWQCAFVLLSCDGTICMKLMDFVVDNFGTADVYHRVFVEGDYRTGQFIFKKKIRSTQNDNRQHIVQIPHILHHTLNQEENCRKIVSFNVRGSSANYNIKFKSERQADIFVKFKALPTYFKIQWARIYSHWRPVIIAYKKFDDGDIGFKLLDNGDYTDIDDRLNQLPYLFRHSDIRNEIRTRTPQTLYLRNMTKLEDYEIMFQSEENLGTFLELFPEKTYDDSRTERYYFVPSTEDSRDMSD